LRCLLCELWEEELLLQPDDFDDAVGHKSFTVATVCHRRARSYPSNHKTFEKRISPAFGDACRRALCHHVEGEGRETLSGRDVQIHGLRVLEGVCNRLDMSAHDKLLPYCHGTTVGQDGAHDWECVTAVQTQRLTPNRHHVQPPSPWSGPGCTSQLEKTGRASHKV